MFVNFFFEVKKAGIPTSLREYLTLLEAMDAKVIGGSHIVSVTMDIRLRIRKMYVTKCIRIEQWRSNAWRWRSNAWRWRSDAWRWRSDAWRWRSGAWRVIRQRRRGIIHHY